MHVTTAYIATIVHLMALSIAAPTGGTDNGNSQMGMTFPSLSGEYCVGKTKVLVLVDRSRNDPFADNPNQAREILLQCYYPIDKDGDCVGESYATSEYAEWLSEFLSGGQAPNFFTSIKTHARTGAKYSTRVKHDQLLLFSHGLGVPRVMYQGVVEDVASNGNIVCAIGHPYDSDFEQFPSKNGKPGKIVRQNAVLKAQAPGYSEPGAKAVEIRTKDVLFVLDQFKKGKIAINGNIDCFKLASRAGMFGHSLGGQLSMVVMLETEDIKVGINYDGWFWLKANATVYGKKSDTKRPYMTMRADPVNGLPPPFQNAGGGPQNMLDAMKVQSNKAKVMPLVKKSSHYSYTDLAPLDAFPSANHTAYLGFMGQVDPKRMYQITYEYTNWFFYHTIKGGNPNIVSKGIEDPAIPEVILLNDTSS